MTVTIEQIRERFPSPVADHSCSSESHCTHYCVLGAVLSTITGEHHSFPEPLELIERLKLDDSDDLTVVKTWQLALAVMQENDKGRFEDAWSRAEQLLALLRERALI